MQLLLEDYIALLRVGILPQERTAPQRVRVSVTAVLSHAPQQDNIHDTFDYIQMITAIDRLAATHVDLLETFATQLAEKLLSNTRISGVEITLIKLDALPNGRVGVHYAASN